MSESKNRCVRLVKQIVEKLKSAVNVSFVCITVLNLALVIIGCMNLKKCPVESNIPIFLVVQGAIGIITKVVGLSRNFLIKYIRVKKLLSTIFTIEFILNILGSFWVYRVYKPNYDDKDSKFYCNKTAYVLAFTYITFLYVVFFGLLFVLICCCCCCLFCSDEFSFEDSKAEPKEDPKEDPNEDPNEKK